jgi:hypothetical protein
MAGNLDEEETKAKKKSLSRVRRLFSFSSGTKAEDQTANDPPGTNRFRRHTLSAGTDTHQDSSGSTGQPASSPGKYTFDFPSPENVGQVRRLRTNIITGAESDPAKSLPASRSDSTALFKTSDKEHKITPNLSEKELMKAMPPLIRDIYDNKCDQFTHELKSALKTSGKKQTPIVFQIVDKHHKRNIFHWIALLNRQNIAKAAVDTINNRQIVDYLLSAIDRDGRTPLHLVCNFSSKVITIKFTPSTNKGRHSPTYVDGSNVSESEFTLW